MLLGIHPIYIRNLNTLQPAQNPKNDSRDANTIKTDIRLIAMTLKPNKKKTVVKIEKINPTAWANLFGGPGTRFSGLFNFGTRNFVTKRANGLILGPDDTLAKNPYTRHESKIYT